MYYSTLGAFYRSKEWNDFRFVVINKRLVNGQTICEHCGKPIVRLYDVILHHKQELTLDNVNDANISLNDKNIMIVHHNCHNEIHSRFGSYTRHKYLVCGGSREDRMKYVKDVSVAGDIICEVHNIRAMVQLGDSNRCDSNVFAIRDALLDMIKTNRGKWINAFVVGEYKYLGERERIANELNLEILDLGSIPPCLN